MKQVNQPHARLDAYEKVTGRARFTADLEPQGCLHARCVYTRHPHARILGVDTSAALRVPGVLAVVSGRDIPGMKTMGEVIQDQYPLALDRVRYMGDVVAAVAAETPEAASRAADLVEVEYEVLPAVFSPEEALLPGAPVIHEAYPDNVCARHHVVKGDVEAGFREAEVIVEGEYRTQFVEHAYIEPEAVLAFPDPPGRGITVMGSIQNPYAVRRTLVRCLGIPMARTRVLPQHVGGSFGGKLEIMEAMSVRAALLALLTGRPVRLVNRREDSFVESHKRHPFIVRHKVGAMKDGTLVALQSRITADSGAYACMTPFVTWRAAIMGSGPYRIPNVLFETEGIYTNNTYTGSMRGFGSPQACFAIESIMDELALALGMDPLSLKLKNALRNGDLSPTGDLLENHRVSVEEVLGRATETAGFREKRALYARPQEGEKRRGIGLAASMRGVSLGAEGVDSAAAVVSVEEDGTVSVATGHTELGQGLATALCQIAVEELGVGIDRVCYLETDTARAPDSGPTVASRSTFMAGNAVRNAARSLADSMKKAVAGAWNVDPGSITAIDGFFKEKGGAEGGYGGNAGNGLPGPGPAESTPPPPRTMTFNEAVNLCRGRGLSLSVVGSYVAPHINWNEKEGRGRPYFTYVYACQVAEVEVDLVTGAVDVLRLVAAHDVGRAINPANVEGQITGGGTMGMGFALFEEVEIREGRTRNPNLDEYTIATAVDAPSIVPIIVENPDPDGPFGAKSIGEPAGELAAPAIANAIFQATGRRLRRLPMDLERVLLGRSLRDSRSERGSSR